MSTVVINQKKYTVPEITFKHLPMIEKCGLSVFDLLSKNYIFTSAQVFVCIVVGCDTEQADYLLEQHFRGGGQIMPLYEAFSTALYQSGFFAEMLGRETKDQTPAENN